MHRPAFLSLSTGTLVAGTLWGTLVVVAGLSPSAVAASEPVDRASQAPQTVVSVRADGIHDVPLRWFDDAVVVPGDRAERTILVRNDRDVAISVDVTIDDVRPEDGALLRDLVIDWGSSSATGSELVTAPVAPVDGEILTPGEELSVRLAFAYPEDAVAPPGGRSLTFDVLIRASADDGAGEDDAGGAGSGTGDGAGRGDGAGTGDGAASGGGLAGTGGVFGPWTVMAALIAAGTGAMLWILGGRRSHRDDHRASERGGTAMAA